MTDQAKPNARARSLFSPSRPTGRLIISTAIGLITIASLTRTRIEWPVRAIAGWDATSFVLLALAWNIILRADAKETKRRAGEDDPGQHTVFVIALVASIVSLFAAVLLKVMALPGAKAVTSTGLTIGAVVLSWALTHTAYTLRYAHLHYQMSRKHDKNSDGGLQFCGPEEPSDIDFAYFAFTIGMCFQVSDVVVKTTGMRREVLLHAVISFVYNTMILALALNVLLGLMS